jgi:CHAT domain-containing protein/tetratricopeptide (TPR) repeat protein
MTASRHRVAGRNPLFLSLFCAVLLFNSCRHIHAEACSLSRTQSPTSQDHSSLVPTLTDTFADTTLESRLRAEYQLLNGNPSRTSLSTDLHATLELAVSSKNRCAEGMAAYALGLLASNNNVREAQDWFNQAQSAFTETHSASGLAHSHFQLAALNHHAVSASESAAAFTSIAEEYDRLGDPIDALASRLQSISTSDPDAGEKFEKLRSQAHELHAPGMEARTHEMWGDNLFVRGRYDQAMLEYQQADSLYVACACLLDERAALQTSMGRLERVQGRPEAAIPHYRLAYHLQKLSGDQSYIPQTLNAISVAYEVMRQYDKAIAYVQQALSVARAIHSQQFVEFLTANLGYLYFQAGQPSRALPLLQQATANLSNDYSRCNRFGQIAEVYLALHQYDDAEASSTKSVEACEREKNTLSTSDSLETRARIRLARGNLSPALDDAHRSLALVEEIRAHLVPEDAHKRGYNEQTLKTYETTIAILARMNRYPEALEITEQSRARAFLDLLSSPHKTAASAISQTSGTANLLESESHAPAMQIAEIIATSERLHSTLLAYWISAANSTLYTWVIRPGQPVFGTSQSIKSSEMESLVRRTLPFTAEARGLRTTSSPSLSPAEARTWRHLYRLLIAPVESHLPTEPGSLLTIVPHRSLFQLSFAALIDPNNRYLVERYSLHSVPAAGLLRYTQQNELNSAQLPPHYVFVANPQHFPQLQKISLPPLPGTGAEVRAIAGTVPTKEVTLLEGAEATESNLARALPTATVLHFATHAIVSGTDPFGSFLALNYNSTDDGLLTTASIYTLHLHTHMVVLSACRTGLGPVSADGVAGLSRAFFYAGSASVLTTLWDVADQPTAVLMPLFYRNLEQGDSRASALRKAQLTLIEDLRRQRVRVSLGSTRTPLPEKPVYWAAFSLSGEP